LLVQREVASAIVRPRRGDSFAIDEIDLVSVSKGRCTFFEGAFLDVVEGAFAAGWGGQYGDSLEGSKRYDLGKEYRFFERLVLMGDLKTLSYSDINKIIAG
jgi:hypothetical protein